MTEQTSLVPTRLLRDLADRLVDVDNARHSLDREHEYKRMADVGREIVAGMPVRVKK